MYIKSIISWNFINSNKILNIKQKIDKDENACYALIAKDSIGIYQFQNYIERFWKFIKYNLLAIDNYREIKEIFYNYIDSILRSYTIPKVYLSEENFFFEEKLENIKIEELSVFDLKCIIEYLGCKELENIFQRYEINEIKVKENEIDEFISIIKNIIDFLKTKNNKYNFSFDINLIFLLLSVIKFDNQQYRTITQYILEYLNCKRLNTNEYKYLNKYLYYQEEYFNNFNLDLLVDILLNILGKISNLENISDIIISTIHNIVCYIHEADKKFKLNNENLINSLFNNSNNDRYAVLIELYRILDVSERHKIRNAIKNKLNSNKYELFECEIYYKSLMLKIIEPNSQYELKYCDFIQNKKKESQVIKSYPDQAQMILEWTNNLILNNCILNKEIFKKFLGILDSFDFFFDINKFEASKFKLEWLNNFSESLIKEIAQNENIKLEVKKKIEVMVLKENKYDQKILEKYFKYFN